ncbi:site-specific DNA-methyltransferase [Tsukamurella sp. NPDC003166]|uniref:DNA-methyltransferase n=1 Tax=Tsukamurella sp. NPDC003166 TaxID=3154444 RepID=UPI0033A0D78A
MFDVLPTLGRFDACIADPPYGTTNLSWDRWPEGWLETVAEHTDTLWCFGTMRSILDHAAEFSGWRFGQDIVWRKNTATSMQLDRFRRQHEQALHFYRGAWPDQHRDLPKIEHHGRPSGTRRRDGLDGSAKHTNHASGGGVFDNHFKPMDTPWTDDGTRWATSVLDVAKAKHRGRINATQKPLGVIEPLIQYSVPAGGVVLDPFAGSGSTGIAARNLGRRAVLIEAREEQCETTAKRLAAADLMLDLPVTGTDDV